MMNWTLRDYRKAVGLSQKKVAESLRCTQANVSLYELGKLAVSVEDIPILAKLFDATIEDIVMAAIETLKQRA